MAGEAKPEREHGEGDAEFVEVDPSGRYGRYREVLGKGAFKTVYKAFDEWEGIEVAWNQVKVADLLRNSDDLERLYSEVHLLKTLKHKNIIKFYNSWVDSKEGNINFITEIFTSGTLRQYRKKHKHVDIRALKNWSRQILQGLHYLHSHDPPVIHRDLKCDNIFVNGNQGEVKIGDLGLAAILLHAQSAHSVIGTPEFMAPELYEEDYNELVDIYAFGMCLLELVTFEYPYVECTNAAQIYKKVTAGIKPASLEKVNDPEVRRFIEKCIAKVSERLPARDLLTDPFLQSDIEDESIGHSSEHGVNHSDDNCRQFGEASSHLNVNADSSIGTRDFTVQGEMKDMNTIFLKLRITDSIGHAHNIYFPFDIEADTSISVSSEMVAELDLTDHDVTVIAAMIDAEIQSHVNGWIPDQPVNESHSNDETALDNFDSGKKDEVSALPPGSDLIRGGLVLERFPSGRKYWCDSPKGVNEESVRHSLSKISRVTHHGNAQNVLEVNDGETSTLNPDEKVDHSNGISSPSQLNASTFSVDCGRHSSCIADQSISFKLHGTSIRSTVNGEDGEDAPHQTNGCASLINLTSNLHIADVSECSGPPSSNANDEAPFCTDHQFADGQVRPVVDQHGDHDNTDLPHDDKTSVETDPDDVKTLLGKLKTLLLEQQKELQELKEKHNLAIKDVLKKLPPDIQDMTLDTYGLNTPLFKIHGEASKSSGHSKNVDFICEEAALPSHVGSFLIHDITEESSSTTNMEEIATSDVGMSCLEGSTSNVGKDERKEHMPGNHLGGLIFRDRSHLWKVDSKSYDVGIAVILIDDLSNTKYEADVPSTKSDEG